MKRPIEFFKTLNHYSKFEKKRMVYDYTDRFSPLLAPDFFEEYEEFKINLALRAIELTGQSDNPVIPKMIDEGDFYRLDLSFDVTDNSTILVSEMIGTIEFEPQANDIRGYFEAEPEPQQKDNTPAVEKPFKEPFGEMFCNGGFELFEYILAEFVKPKNTKGRFEDISYFYRCLFEDKFIHQKPEAFREWFNRMHLEEFTKIKTKTQTSNPQRKKDYSTALDWFKTKNN